MTATTRPTSVAAKVAIAPSAAKQRARVFLYILNQGEAGATLNEIEAALGLAGNTVRPRRLELEKKGLVKDSGKRRPTPSGRAAIVWVVPENVANRALAKLSDRAVS